MSEITLHLTPEELAHLHEATEYHFQNAKGKVAKARLYGRVITKLEAAQESAWQFDALRRTAEGLKELDEGRHTTLEQFQAALTDPPNAEVALETYEVAQPKKKPPEAPQMDTAPPAEADPPQRPEGLEVGSEVVVRAPGDYFNEHVYVAAYYGPETVQVRDKDGILLGDTFPARSLEIPEFVEAGE